MRTEYHCQICEQPVTVRGGICMSCAGKLRCARARAARLSDTQKRDIAKAGVRALAENGYVRVRLVKLGIDNSEEV